MDMDMDMEETYFTTARPLSRDDQQAPNKRRRGMRPHRKSALPDRSHRRPIRQVNLSGFFCKPGDREYAAAAKATGTKGNTPIYWFKEYGYEQTLFDEVDAVDEIRTMSQAERDAILYPHTVKKPETAPAATRADSKSLTSSLRGLKSKGKQKTVHFAEQAMEDENGQPLSKPTEEEHGRDIPDAEMADDPEWML